MKFEERICELCCKEFMPNSNRQSICKREHLVSCSYCSTEFDAFGKYTAVQILNKDAKKYHDSACALADKKVNCITCGKEFSRNSPKQKECSGEHLINCSQCGLEFNGTGLYTFAVRNRDSQPFYCGKSCRSEAKKAHVKRLKKVITVVNCEKCHKDFSGNVYAKVCSECAKNYCKNCGNEIINGKSEVYCSEDCRKELLSKSAKKSLQSRINNGTHGNNNSPEAKAKRAATNIERYGVENVYASEVIKEKLKQINLDRYGVENSFQAEEIKEKIKEVKLERYSDENYNNFEQRKETMLEKYGIEHALQLPEIQKKWRQTNLEKYGFDYGLQSPEIREKIKETSMRLYGVPNVLQAEEIKEKGRQTSLKNYGMEHPMQSQKVQEKVKETSMKKYGVPFVLQAEEVKKKIKKSNLDKYSVEHPMQAAEVKDKIKETVRDKFGVSSVLQSEEVRLKIKETMINRYGVEHPTQSLAVQEHMMELHGVPYYIQSEEMKEKSKITKKEKYGVEFISQSEEFLLSMSGPFAKKISDADFEFFVKSFPNNNNRKPTLTDLAREFGYANPASIGERVRKLKLREFIEYNDSYLIIKMRSFLKDLGIFYVENDRKQIKPLELDFYIPEFNLAIEVNDFLTHNSTYTPWGSPKDKNYHLNKTLLCRENGIRLIHAWEHQILDDDLFAILKNAIKHACGVTEKTVYARNCRIEERPAIAMKEFFLKNNIEGYRGATTAYVLVDKKTNEDVMCYLVGASSFGKKKYDAEIARGASKLGHSVVGGASKLWKHIISTTDYNSIVYYVDLNLYDGNSLDFLDGVEFISEKSSFRNYWVSEGVLKNRQPTKHAEIKALVAAGEVWEVWNAGTQVNVWRRKS